MDQPPTISGWRALRSVVVTLIAVLALLLLAPITIWLLHDGSNMPLCHKEALFDVMNWLDKKGRIALPNVPDLFRPPDPWNSTKLGGVPEWSDAQCVTFTWGAQ